MNVIKSRLRMLWRANFLGHAGFVSHAIVILIVFAALHLLGWRDDTRILSGTSLPSSGAVFRGFLYATAYFAAVILAPILLLAGAIQAAIQRATGSNLPIKMSLPPSADAP
jgi:hypothetical protein